MRNHLILLLGILTVTVPQVFPKPMQLPASPSERAVLRGVVMREGTSDPIPDVQVTLAGQAVPGARFGQDLQTLQTLADQTRARGLTVPPNLQAALAAAARGVTLTPIQLITKSDSAGRFSFAGVPVGQYSVRAEREGYFGPYTGNGRAAFVTTTATVVAGQQSPDLAFSLIPGAAIGGRVSDSEGRPVVNSNVQAFRIAYQNGSPTLQAGATTTTNDRGEYRLFRIPPGDYYVSATPAGQGPRGFRGNGARNAVPVSREGAVQTFYPDVVEAAAALPVSLKGGEDLSGMNINLRTAATVRVSGQVVNTVSFPERAGPRGNVMNPTVNFLLFPRDRNALQDSTSPSMALMSLAGPANGRFELNGILPGSYDLYARVLNPGGAREENATLASMSQPTAYFGRTSFETRGEDIEGLSIVVHEGVELKGLTTIDGNAALAGAVRIDLQSDDTARWIPVYQNRGRGQPAPVADGSFSIPLVNEGLYRFLVNITPMMAAAARGPRGAPNGLNLEDAYVDDIRQGGVSVYDMGLRVGAETPGLIEVVMKTGGGVINGVVNDAERKPKPGAAVTLVPAQQRRQNIGLHKTATSDPTGRFTIRGIAPGVYTLFAWDNIPAGAHQNEAFLAPYESRGQVVNVSSMSTTNAQVTLISRNK